MATKKKNNPSAQIVLDKIAEGLTPIDPILVDLGDAGTVEFEDYLSWTGEDRQQAMEIAAMISDGMNVPGWKVAQAWLSDTDFEKWQAAGMSMNQENVIIVRVVDEYQKALGFTGFLEGE